MAESEARHAEAIEAVKAANKAHRSSHIDLLRQRKEVEIENLSRQARAKAEHKARLEALHQSNELLLKKSQVRWM